MHYNRVDDPASAAPQLLHREIGPVIPADGWGDLRFVFCDRNGAVYSILPSGELRKNQLTVSGDTASLEQPELGSPLGPGWTDVLHVFSADPGRFLSVDLRGVLRYNEEQPVDHGPPALAHPGPGPPLATCWDTLVAGVGAGARGVYGIMTEGQLLYTRLRIVRGRPKLMERGHGKPVGTTMCKACRWSTMVEGYCRPLSVAPGHDVEFKISVNPQGAPAKQNVSYHARYVRLRRVVREVPPHGFVDISDYRQMGPAGNYTADLQNTRPRAWENGCDWTTSFTLKIPNDGTWPSGLYAAECSPDGDQSEKGAYYVVFIVKPPAGERGKLAVLSNINTWNAYNCWGGSSKYCCRRGWPLPSRLSFERPCPGTCPSELQTRQCPEVRPQTAHLTRAELWVLTWLEDNGYPFHLYSDYDLDQGIEGISEGNWRYKALILNTHPEYWTIRMYAKLRSYVAGGGDMIYFGADGLYHKVQYIDRTGRVMKVLQGTTAKARATCDNNTIRRKSLFRPKRPERSILGVGFENVRGLTPAPYEVKKPKHPFFAGVTNNLIGTQGLYCPASGWEIDVRGKRPSRRITLLARGKDGPGIPSGAEMVHRTNKKGGFVFSAGSLIFGASLVVDCDLQRVVKNVLEAALV